MGIIIFSIISTFPSKQIPLGKKLIFFSSIGFEIQNNYGSETLEFELHSFRAFQLYLTDKNQHMVKEQCQFLF